MSCSHKRDKGLVLPFGLLHKKSMKALNLFSLSVAILSLVMNAGAAVSVDPMFSDHMVLQRDLAVPVWGKAEPGEKVKVSFRKQAKETVANEKGEWMIKLDPLKLGAAAELMVEGKAKTTFKDVSTSSVTRRRTITSSFQ